jgi:hypothetical protein
MGGRSIHLDIESYRYRKHSSKHQCPYLGLPVIVHCFIPTRSPTVVLFATFTRRGKSNIFYSQNIGNCETLSVFYHHNLWKNIETRNTSSFKKEYQQITDVMWRLIYNINCFSISHGNTLHGSCLTHADG